MAILNEHNISILVKIDIFHYFFSTGFDDKLLFSGTLASVLSVKMSFLVYRCKNRLFHLILGGWI